MLTRFYSNNRSSYIKGGNKEKYMSKKQVKQKPDLSVLSTEISEVLVKDSAINDEIIQYIMNSTKTVYQLQNKFNLDAKTIQEIRDKNG
jgi:hypothetical protein